MKIMFYFKKVLKQLFVPLVILFSVALALPPENIAPPISDIPKIDSIVLDGIQNKAFPGCQVYVLKDGKVIYDKSFGNFTYDTIQKVQSSTIYDLASLSKTTGTLLAIMKLYDGGKLKLTDKASQYLTFLRATDKENITIRDLLLHETGLPGSMEFYRAIVEKNNTANFLPLNADSTHSVQLGNQSYKYKAGWTSKIQTPQYITQIADSFYMNNNFHSKAMEMIAKTKLGSKSYLYSCVNFMLLKEIAEAISGMTMDVFLEKEFFVPMQLNTMSYLPLRSHPKEEITPTLKKDFLRNGQLQGYVHDPDAALLGGVSGNAGLFASAHDVAQIYQMLLNGGELDGKRYLCTETCRVFTTTTSLSGRRGLGFDKPNTGTTGFNPCCKSAPSATYGHTGYTGTCCWVDPVNKLVYVFLSNRTYPNDGVNKLAKMRIRPKIQEAIYQFSILPLRH